MTAKASLPLSGIIAATIPLIILGVVFVAKISQPISEKQQSLLDRLNRISRENLSGIRVIRAFDNDAYEQQRFDETNEQFTSQSKKLFKIMMMTSPIFSHAHECCRSMYLLGCFIIDSKWPALARTTCGFHGLFVPCDVFNHVMYRVYDVSAGSRQCKTYPGSLRYKTIDPE